MLARREPVSLRSLVAGTEVSTMAVYTYFDGMPGLLGAVRQEGFSRLAARLATLPTTDDPVRDLAAVGAAYAASVHETPELYALMFDGSLPLPDGPSADASLQILVDQVRRAVDDGRFDRDVDPVALGYEVWLFGHGACMLVATGVLPFEQVEPIMTSGLVRLYRGAGDAAEAAARSVERGWVVGFGAAEQRRPGGSPGRG